MPRKGTKREYIRLPDDQEAWNKCINECRENNDWSVLPGFMTKLYEEQEAKKKAEDQKQLEAAKKLVLEEIEKDKYLFGCFFAAIILFPGFLVCVILYLLNKIFDN